MENTKAVLIAYSALGGVRAPRGAMDEELFLDEAIISDLLRKVRNGILNDTVRNLLNLVEPGWEFHGERLGLISAERELSEIWAVCWLKCQHEAADKGFLTEERLQYLDFNIPGWRTFDA